MPVITLPDGSKKTFDQAVTVMQVAESIGAGLAKAALAGVVNGVEADASFVIEQDATLSIITSKQPAGLEVLRHSTAHLLAQAVKQLFPSAQVTIGPVIAEGFYYDFSFERTFTPEDLLKIETRMQELAKQAQPVSRSVMSRDQAIQFFDKLGEKYKVEIIKDIPATETLSLYTQGDFTDLCRGPHVPNTSHLKVFKLTRVSGAYWRGDSKNEMLQRIYGTAFADKKEMDAHFHQLEEAEKRDHRKIGKALDLFHLQEEAPGMVFWHENGWTIWQVVEQYIRGKQHEAGYREIKTPQVVDVSLWQRSGHTDKYLENMFLTNSENRQYAVKPMSCPCHVQVFNHGLKSYRDLPIRFSEFGVCHRNESSGSLHGIMRVRGMCQDDGHVFCTEDQIQDEVAAFMRLAFSMYRDFGLDQIRVKLATRPPKRIGDDASWDKAEKALADALTSEGITFEYLPGEGAFYGPKIELHLKDCIGREWQCGTMQVDPFMPARLDASYIDEHSARKVPMMLHRATLGSLERFIGMLIEHYAGAFPVWLAPVQAVVLNITDKQDQYAEKIHDLLQKNGIRAQIDLRNEKIGFKIREHTLQKVPYLCIVGDKEMDANTITVRTRKGDDLGAMTFEQLNKLLNEQIALKGKSSVEM
jgi:threonyl-tRNA synthetase